MNEDTRFILRRIESLEGRVMSELKELHAFKNKAIGIVTMLSFTTGAIGAFVMQMVSKYI